MDTAAMSTNEQRRKNYRRARERVAKGILAPAGFVKGKHMFVRVRGEQIHAISFQPNTYGGSYFVNVAFHYTFLPPFLAFANETEITPREMCEVDFLFLDRLENLLEPRGKKGEWSYGETFEESEAVMAENTHNALSVLEIYSEKWKNLGVLLDLVPPELFSRHIAEWKDFERRRAIDHNLPSSERKFPIHDAFGGRWIKDLFSLSYALAVIATRSGDLRAAASYAECTRQVAFRERQERRAEELLARIEATK